MSDRLKITVVVFLTLLCSLALAQEQVGEMTLSSEEGKNVCTLKPSPTQ